MRAACVTAMLLAGAAVAHADLCQSNVMIVLDRSCSMQQPPKAGGAMSKWQIAGAAIDKLTTQYKGMLDFGLIMFPDQTGQQCLQDGAIYVNVGAGNETKIASTLAATMPNGPCVTDIKPAFDQVSSDPAYAMPYTSGPRGFVLFISDGMQTCGGGNAQIVQSIQKLYNDGYPTYIVGFGGAVSPAALDMFATAGGVPRKAGPDGGGEAFYRADDAAGLDAALGEIASAVINTEFGGCPGLPCPDGRCYGNGQCVNGFCYTSQPDASAGMNGDGGNGNGGNGHTTGGCGCELGASHTAPVGAIALVALGAALALTLRARRTRATSGRASRRRS
jgi:hypothetical protein